MKQNYHDIIDRFGEPIWWDEAACPRSTPFTPTLANGFHAREVALRITSQHCRHEFAVCVPSGPRDSRPLSKREFPLVYGDPHRDCCQIEASATSDALAIMGLWSQDNGQWIVSGTGGALYPARCQLVDWPDEKSSSSQFQRECQRDCQHRCAIPSERTRTEGICFERGFTAGAIALLDLPEADRHDGSPAKPGDTRGGSRIPGGQAPLPTRMGPRLGG